MNLQVISAPDGEILWVSGPLPGAVHDLTAARIWGVLRELAAMHGLTGGALETGRNMRNRASPDPPRRDLHGLWLSCRW